MTPGNDTESLIERLIADLLAGTGKAHDGHEERIRKEAAQAIASLQAQLAEMRAWRPIETAPKDRTPILALFHPDIYPRVRPQREDLERWNGVQVTLHHPGILPDGFNMGWNVAAPVGHGGFPDEWIAGWMPLPEAPAALTPKQEDAA